MFFGVSKCKTVLKMDKIIIIIIKINPPETETDSLNYYVQIVFLCRNDTCQLVTFFEPVLQQDRFNRRKVLPVVYTT